jgi:hypothetical protein
MMLESLMKCERRVGGALAAINQLAVFTSEIQIFKFPTKNVEVFVSISLLPANSICHRLRMFYSFEIFCSIFRPLWHRAFFILMPPPVQKTSELFRLDARGKNSKLH